MTKLKTFSQTSDQSYDRHHYKIVYTNGRTIVVDDYMEVYQVWLTTESTWLSHVEVLDVEYSKPKKSTKGFV